MGTRHVRLDFPVSTSALRPYNSMICPGNGPKSPQKLQMPTATNQEEAISLATWLKMRFRGHLLHPQPPTFCGLHPSEVPKRTPRPPYLGPLGCGKLKPKPKQVGAQMGQ